MNTTDKRYRDEHAGSPKEYPATTNEKNSVKAAESLLDSFNQHYIKIASLRKALEEIEAQAVVGILARDPDELLSMMDNICVICRNALKS